MNEAKFGQEGASECQVKFNPAYYTAMFTKEAMFDLIQTLRIAARDLDVSPTISVVLEALYDAYDGDLPPIPGDYVDPVTDETIHRADEA